MAKKSTTPEVVDPIEPLTELEQHRFAELETIVERGLETFVEVGNALQEIRAGKFYRANYSTFEQYCREKYGMTRQHANRQIQAAAVAALMEPTGSIPMNERQARALAPLMLRNPDKGAELFQQLHAEQGDKLTAETVHLAVEDVLHPASPYKPLTDAERLVHDLDAFSRKTHRDLGRLPQMEMDAVTRGFCLDAAQAVLREVAELRKAVNENGKVDDDGDDDGDDIVTALHKQTTRKREEVKSK